MRQSLIVLKALTYTPTGGIVAAPTTSLPEQIGGARNWDYRYCWLRDATLTLRAMLNAGYSDEAHGWRDWLLRAIAGDPADIQILYGVAGERRLFERELDWLAGYEGSRPVRTGNARARPAAAGRVRRADRLGLPDARARHRRRRQRLVAAADAAGVAGGRLAPEGQRASGRCAARAATSCTRR